MPTLAHLLHGMPHRRDGEAETTVDIVTADSRRVREGSVFVAVRGTKVDGHSFVDRAVEAGASAVVVDSAGEAGLDLPTTVTKVVVEHTGAALGHLVRRLHGEPDLGLEVVAVTGTNGKTTVSHLVRDLLEATGRRCGLIGTIVYDDLDSVVPAPLTTPGAEELLPLLATVRDRGGHAVSMEASSHALDQRRLAGIEVDVGAFTNITREHLDYHVTMEAYVAAKMRLLEHLSGASRTKRPGRAVVSLDDPVLAAQEWPAGTIFVGAAAVADVRSHHVRCDARGIELEVEIEGRPVQLHSRLLGTYNVANLLTLAGIAHALGIEIESMPAAFEALRPVPGRLEPVALAGGPLTLIDYAHTPDGVRSTLSAVRGLAGGRLFVVFGCGGDRDRGKRPQMARAAIEAADHVVLTLDNPRTEDPEQIFADTMPGFAAAPERAERIDDRREAIARVLTLAGPSDTVVVCGKGHETYQIIGDQKLPWDDRVVLREAWSALGGER